LRSGSLQNNYNSKSDIIHDMLDTCEIVVRNGSLVTVTIMGIRFL